jgi:hypothetical protein
MPDTKRIMLESRLQKRLRVLGLPDFETYIDRVFSGDDVELIHMIDAVTTNKTDFFREPDHFDILSNRLLPAAMTRNPVVHSFHSGLPVVPQERSRTHWPWCWKSSEAPIHLLIITYWLRISLHRPCRRLSPRYTTLKK